MRFEAGAAIAIAIAIAHVTLCSPSAALANDVSFGGAGADLVPLDEARVQMVSESIELERRAPGGYRVLGQGYWRVRATYRFKSLVAARVTLRIGFPEPTCWATGDCSFSGFKRMQTTVRGQKVKLTSGKISKRHTWSKAVRRVHLFRVTFAPRETVEVVHTYRHGKSEHVNGGEFLIYLTRTGAPWAKSIGRARFTVTLPFRPWGLILGPWGPHLRKLEETLVGGRSRSRLIFERRRWEPKADLNLHLGAGAPIAGNGTLLPYCPHPTPSGKLYVDAKRPPTLPQLRRCRNAVFAHHGKVFRDSKLNSFFYGKKGLRVLKKAVFAKNPSYSAKMLTKAERRYVRQIIQLERTLRGRARDR